MTNQDLFSRPQELMLNDRGIMGDAYLWSLMRLDLARCTVRSWREDDVAAIVRYAGDLRVWRNLRDAFPHPYTPEEAQTWVQSAPRRRPETHFAIEMNGEAIGGVGLNLKQDVYRRGGEIGYWLGVPFWGRGLATEVLVAMTPWAIETFDLCRVQANVFGWNPASARVLEKAGYTFEGRLRNAVWKDGALTDELIYSAVR
jgi:ribosomal-protein-alanine N-acetyltransferase